MSKPAATQITADEQNIKTLWTALQVAEGQLQKRGLAFGQAVFEFRQKSEVVQGGTSFRATLEKLNIPHSTAYFWIAKYEESVGTREPKPAPVATPEPTPVEREEVEIEPTLEDRLDSIPPRTKEDVDREQLGFLVHRLESLTKAVQQVADNNAKWSKHEEYAEVVALVKMLGKLGDLLDGPEDQPTPPSPGARTRGPKSRFAGGRHAVPERKIRASAMKVAPTAKTHLARPEGHGFSGKDTFCGIHMTRRVYDPNNTTFDSKREFDKCYNTKPLPVVVASDPTCKKCDHLAWMETQYQRTEAKAKITLIDTRPGKEWIEEGGDWVREQRAQKAKVTPPVRGKTHIACPDSPGQMMAGQPMCGAYLSVNNAIVSAEEATCKRCQSLKAKYEPSVTPEPKSKAPAWTPKERRDRREAYQTIKSLEAKIKSELNGQRRKEYIDDVANGVGDGSLADQDRDIARYRERIEGLRESLAKQKPAAVTLDAVKAMASSIYPSLEEK
jgi:transposase-like protein